MRQTGVVFSMMRGAVIAGIAVMLTLVAAATLISKHYGTAVLNDAELELRPISVPRLWANECSKIRRMVAKSRARVTKKSAISADEVAIYRAVIAGWKAGSRTALNVSNTTEPLDGSDSSPDLSNCECLDGLDAESIVDAARSSHKLTRDIRPVRHIILVDAGTQMLAVRHNDPEYQLGDGKPIKELVNKAFTTGLFSLSEIAFDREHRRALVRYSFVCGMLCGSGRALLFEKVNGEWKKSGLDCGGWIS